MLQSGAWRHDGAALLTSTGQRLSGMSPSTPLPSLSPSAAAGRAAIVRGGCKPLGSTSSWGTPVLELLCVRFFNNDTTFEESEILLLLEAFAGQQMSAVERQSYYAQVLSCRRRDLSAPDATPVQMLFQHEGSETLETYYRCAAQIREALSLQTDYEAYFMQFDANNSRTLDKGEMTAMLHDLQASLSDAELEIVMAQGAGDNGHFSLREFVHAFGQAAEGTAYLRPRTVHNSSRGLTRTPSTQSATQVFRLESKVLRRLTKVRSRLQDPKQRNLLRAQHVSGGLHRLGQLSLLCGAGSVVFFGSNMLRSHKKDSHPCVCAQGVILTEGCWYFEVWVFQANGGGRLSIGCIDARSSGGAPILGDGRSWAIEGLGKKGDPTHAGHAGERRELQGVSFRVGSTLGVQCDLESGRIVCYHDGEQICEFEGVHPAGGLLPAFSIDHGVQVQIVFGGAIPFRFPPAPSAALPVASFIAAGRRHAAKVNAAEDYGTLHCIAGGAEALVQLQASGRPNHWTIERKSHEHWEELPSAVLAGALITEGCYWYEVRSAGSMDVGLSGDAHACQGGGQRGVLQRRIRLGRCAVEAAGLRLDW